MIVAKFGGTSVGTAQRMRNVAGLINDRQPKVIVLSAMSGTTNALLEIAEGLRNGDRSNALHRIAELESNYKAVVDELYDSEDCKRLGGNVVKTLFDQLRSFANCEFSITTEKIIAAQGELLSTALFHLYLTERKIAAAMLPALDFMRIDEHGEPDMETTAALVHDQIKKKHRCQHVCNAGFHLPQRIWRRG